MDDQLDVEWQDGEHVNDVYPVKEEPLLPRTKHKPVTILNLLRKNR